MICKSLRSGIDDVWNYMLAVNMHMCKMKNEMPDQDMQEVLIFMKQTYFFCLLSNSFRLFFSDSAVPSLNGRTILFLHQRDQ